EPQDYKPRDDPRGSGRTGGGAAARARRRPGDCPRHPHTLLRQAGPRDPALRRHRPDGVARGAGHEGRDQGLRWGRHHQRRARPRRGLRRSRGGRHQRPAGRRRALRGRGAGHRFRRRHGERRALHGRRRRAARQRGQRYLRREGRRLPRHRRVRARAEGRRPVRREEAPRPQRYRGRRLRVPQRASGQV
ncbi:MAG: Alkaline phosphatase, partial [uncultured Rubrobacteraceae bacterium]